MTNISQAINKSIDFNNVMSHKNALYLILEALDFPKELMSFYKKLPEDFSYEVFNSFEELNFDPSPGDVIIGSDKKFWEITETFDFLKYPVVRPEQIINREFYKAGHKPSFKFPVVLIENGVQYL